MSRAHFYRPIQDSEGNLVIGALVRVIDEVTDLDYEGDIFVDAEGSEVRTNPYTSEDGIAQFYLAQNTRLALGVTPPDEEEVIIPDLMAGQFEPRETIPFSVSGVQTVRPYLSRYYVEDPYEVTSVRVSVGQAPTGADLIVDLNLNGSSIFASPAERPRILDGEEVGISNPEGLTVAPGDYFSVDVDQIGSGYAGSDLTVQVRMRRLD